MDEQDHVAAFVAEHGLEAPPEFRLLDLVSEVGEVAKDTVESANYGASPAEVHLSSDEVGDVLFSVLALSESLGVDAGEALAEAMAKYEGRVEEDGSPGSGG